MTPETKGRRPPSSPRPERHDAPLPFRIFRRVGAASDGLEIFIVAGLGTALFLGLTVVLPIFVARELFRTSQPFLGTSVLVLSGLMIACGVHDAMRRRWSAASTITAALWIGCGLFVLISLA